MTIEIKVPVLPESVEDATIATWHKQAGETIRRDENLVDLETDKVVLEVPASASGTIKEIKVAEGGIVHSGDVLALIEEGEVEEEAPDSGNGAKAEKSAEETTEKTAEEAGEERSDEDRDEAEKQPAKAAAPDQDSSRLAGLSPAARRVAEEKKVDLSKVEGTGRGGRITKSDVLGQIKGGGSRQEERVRMTRLRSRIAERMKQAQNTAAILTSFNEVDLKAVMDLRRQYQQAFTEKYEIKLGLMSFFVKACCHALRKHPVVNASIDGDEIVYHNYQDVGIAVSTERGLLVPVMRNAETLGLAEIETTIAEFAGKARDGSIALEDLQGGTFSITNGGVFGSLLSTPLLNPPQSAILGMHAIKDRPMVVGGEIVVRPMMYLALSYDHRLVDGKDAVQFLVTVKETLEDPARLLLGL